MTTFSSVSCAPASLWLLVANTPYTDSPGPGLDVLFSVNVERVTGADRSFAVTVALVSAVMVVGVPPSATTQSGPNPPWIETPDCNVTDSV
jgi:hypothetical protein